MVLHHVMNALTCLQKQRRTITKHTVHPITNKTNPLSSPTLMQFLLTLDLTSIYCFLPLLGYLWGKRLDYPNSVHKEKTNKFQGCL